MLWLALPVVLGGAVHILAIRRDVLPTLARIPLDGGRTVRGRSLFGANKTVRGVVVMVSATAAASVALAGIARRVPALAALAVTDLQHQRPVVWGLMLGIGYVLGELPNSFAKRQLGIAPGEPAHGGLRALFWVVDQVDSLFGVLLVLSMVWVPPLDAALGLVALTLAVHPAMAAVMFGLGLKQRIG